ncbi:hypothetical protein FA15DRAFT_605491, partial [Coprinopsis marcescibilis]
DGHISHYSLGFLTYAHECNIVVIYYPSHTTHIYQGLDVVIFAVWTTGSHPTIYARPSENWCTPLQPIHDHPSYAFPQPNHCSNSQPPHPSINPTEDSCRDAAESHNGR